MSGVKSLRAAEESHRFWLHSDHTHWLLGLHDNHVAVDTKTGDVLSYGATVGGERVRVGVRWMEEKEGEWVWLVMGEGENELTDKVLLRERGRPVQVHIIYASCMYVPLLVTHTHTHTHTHERGGVMWVRTI